MRERRRPVVSKQLKQQMLFATRQDRDPVLRRGRAPTRREFNAF